MSPFKKLLQGNHSHPWTSLDCYEMVMNILAPLLLFWGRTADCGQKSKLLSNFALLHPLQMFGNVIHTYTYDHRTFESYLWNSNAVKSHPVNISVLFAVSWTAHSVSNWRKTVVALTCESNSCHSPPNNNGKAVHCIYVHISSYFYMGSSLSGFVWSGSSLDWSWDDVWLQSGLLLFYCRWV